MADAPLKQLFSEQTALLARILASKNSKEALDLLATLTGNIVSILEGINNKQEENYTVLANRIDSMLEFLKADSERMSASLDRMAARLEATATSAEMRDQNAAIQKQLRALLSQPQPK